MRKHLRVTHLAFLLVFSVMTACTAQPAAAPSATAPGTAAATTVSPKPAAASVVVGGPTLQPPQLGNLWVFVPNQHGFADDVNLKIEFKDTGNASNAFAALAANQIDFAIPTLTTTFSAAARTNPGYRIVMASGINGDFVVLVNADRIKSVKDLESATVATIQIGTIAYAETIALLGRSGLDAAKVKWYPTQTAVGQQTALIANQADATVVHINEAQNAIRKAKDTGVHLGILLDAAALQKFAPTGGILLVASEKAIAEHRDVVQRFVDAQLRGMRLIYNDSAKFYDTANKLQPGVNSADDLKTLYDVVRPTLAVNGGLSTEPFRQVFDNWALFSDPKAGAMLTWQQFRTGIDHSFVKSFLQREGVVKEALDVPDWQ